jgi:phage terminase Nu1 subunit (DNA packaging protein)
MSESVSSSSDLIVGDDKLAAVEGVTTKTVYNWRKAGLPCRKVEGGQFEYRLADVRAFLEAYRPAEDAEGAKLAHLLKRAAIEEKVAKVRKLKRQEQLAAGEVLDREVYELHLVEAVQKARDRFLRLPESIGKLLPPESRQEITDELRREILVTLNELHADLERGPE